jgi:probable F420-dependent oxidoreductase
VRLSVNLFPFDRWGDYETLARAVVLAEAAGIDAVALPEHLVMARRPGHDPLSVVWYENFVLASNLAARTSRIGFVFSAYVVPYRSPVLAAKTIATLDVVSAGRVTVVVGTGWLRDEFAALGVPHAERGVITDEYIQAMKTLWTQEQPRFAGKHVAFDNIAFFPRCVQQPHVPLLIGGQGRRALRRAIELGDGWAPMPLPAHLLRAGIDDVCAGVAALGRPTDGLRFVGGVTVGSRDAATQAALEHVSRDGTGDPVVAPCPSAVLSVAHEQESFGVTDFRLGFAWESPNAFCRTLEWLGSEVVPELRAIGASEGSPATGTPATGTPA